MSPYDTPQWKALQDFWQELNYIRSCAYGLHTLMMRNYSKAWCGYVAVPAHHPLFGFNYLDRIRYPSWSERPIGEQSPMTIFASSFGEASNLVSLDILIDAPGSLTWAADHAPSHPQDGLWWFGFDCSHYNDLTPKAVFESFSGYPYSIGSRVYRNQAWVSSRVRYLASQLSDFTSSNPEHFL